MSEHPLGDMTNIDQGVDFERDTYTLQCPRCGNVAYHAPLGTTCVGQLGFHVDHPTKMEPVNVA